MRSVSSGFSVTRPTLCQSTEANSKRQIQSRSLLTASSFFDPPTTDLTGRNHTFMPPGASSQLQWQWLYFARYCNHHVCMSVGLSARVCQKPHAQSTQKFFEYNYVTFVGGSFLLRRWRQWNMSCTSGFTDDVMFSHMGRLPVINFQRIRQGSAQRKYSCLVTSLCTDEWSHGRWLWDVMKSEGHLHSLPSVFALLSHVLLLFTGTATVFSRNPKKFQEIINWKQM